MNAARAKKTSLILFGCAAAAVIGGAIYAFIFHGLEPKINSKILSFSGALLALASAAFDKAKKIAGESLTSRVLDDRVRRNLEQGVDGLITEMGGRRTISLVCLLSAMVLGIILESEVEFVRKNYDWLALSGFCLFSIGVMNALVVRHQQNWLIDLSFEIKNAEVRATEERDALARLSLTQRPDSSKGTR